MEQHDLRRRRRSPPLTFDPKPLPELARSASASSAVTVDNASKGFSHPPLVNNFTSFRIIIPTANLVMDFPISLLFLA